MWRCCLGANGVKRLIDYPVKGNPDNTSHRTDDVSRMGPRYPQRNHPKGLSRRALSRKNKTHDIAEDRRAVSSQAYVVHDAPSAC